MANQWQIRQGQAIHGPFSDAQLRQLFDAGRIDADTPVRGGDNAAWQKAGSVLNAAAQSGTGAEADIDSIVDEVLGNVTPTPSTNTPAPSQLPQGWQHPPRPAPSTQQPVQSTPAPQKAAPPPPARRESEAVPNYDGFQTLSGLFTILGGLSLFGVVFWATRLLGNSGNESGVPRELAIPVLAYATVQTLGFFAVAAVLSGMRDGLRSLRQIANANERIATQLRSR